MYASHHTPATGGEEERDIETIKWMGIIRRPMLDKGQVGGNLARTPGVTPPIFYLRSAIEEF